MDQASRRLTTTTGRALATEPQTYADLCDMSVDFLAGGEAQLAHVKAHLLRRLGQVEPSRKNPVTDETVSQVARGERIDTDAGGIIRQELTELVIMPTVESIVADLAVLYSADDQRRVYLVGKDEAEGVSELIEEHHRKGLLAAKLQQLDELVVLLRTACLLVRWSDKLRRITYDVVLPHWVRVLPHPEHPLETQLAYAISYHETTSDGAPAWCTYVRPELDGDEDGAPTRGYPMGRLVRYGSQRAPWPIPERDDDRIIEDGDNPLAEIGGMEDDQMLWSPIVFHWARPPIETLHLPPPTQLVRLALEVDIAWSLLLRVANMQSSGIPVMRGGGSPPTSLSPSTLVIIDDPQGDFYFAAPGANTSGHVEVIKALLITFSMLSSLSPDSYSMTRPSVQTGPAKLLEQHNLAERRWARTLTADQWEAGRFELERLYHNAYADGPEIPLSVRQEMRWGELRVPIDRNAQVQRLAAERALKVISRLDAVMEVHGVDRDAGEAKIAEIDQADQQPPPSGDGGGPSM